MTSWQHIPVLARECLEAMGLQPGDRAADGTVGLGGHTRLLLDAVGDTGHVYGTDWDPASRTLATENLGTPDNFTLLPCSFAQMHEHVAPGSLQGVLLDLGVSSAHYDDPSRGMSYRFDGPLDLRMDESATQTAAELIASSSAEELCQVIRDYGEERMAPALARRMVEGRPQTTLQLMEIIEQLCPRAPRKTASRVFQALRIAVNDELGELESALKTLPDLLAPGGKLLIITFHSLEDRLVKKAFQEKIRDPKTKGDWELLWKRGVQPSSEECEENPRARSARVRGVERK